MEHGINEMELGNPSLSCVHVPQEINCADFERCKSLKPCNYPKKLKFMNLNSKETELDEFTLSLQF